MNSLRFHDDAMAELDAAIVWYDERRPGLGLVLLQSVQEVLGHIAENPLTGAIGPVLPLRQCRIRRFPYIVYWLQQDEVIWVMAIAHVRRRPGYWMERRFPS